jgi:hypothetical protein
MVTWVAEHMNDVYRTYITLSYTYMRFRFLRPCIVNIRRKEKTNKLQLIRCLLSNFLSQHVSGIIMPIIRRIRPCPTACGVLPGCVGCGWLWSCGVASCTTMIGIMMPETCWDRKFDNKHRISCILLVLSLHLTCVYCFRCNILWSEFLESDFDSWRLFFKKCR